MRHSGYERQPRTPKALLAVLLFLALLSPLAASAAGTAVISGVVTAEDGTTPLEGIEVRLWQYSGGTWSLYYGVTATTTAGGAYSFSGLPGNKPFGIEFRDSSGEYAGEFYDDKAVVADATQIVLGIGEVRSGIDARLTGAGTISGTIRDSSGAPIAGVTVNAFRRRGESYETSIVAASTTSLADGTYALRGLAGDTYGLQFYSAEYADHYRSTVDTLGVTELDLATPLTVDAGQTVADVDETMLRWGYVAGSVTSSSGPVANTFVQPYRSQSGAWWLQAAGAVASGSDGTFTSGRLYPGRYRVLLTAAGFPAQYHYRALSVGAGRDVMISEDSTTSLDTSLLVTDTVPPVTNASGIPGGWSRSDLTVSLDATDGPDGSGVAGVTFRLGSAEATLYQAPFVISAEGSRTLAFAAVDGFGNVETTKTAEVRIDKTAPETTSTAPAGWSRFPVTVSFSAADALSGVAGTFVAVGGANAVPTSSVTVEAQGTTPLAFASADVAGNREATKTAAVRIDDEAPETTASIDATYAGRAVIPLVASDALSGVASTRWTVDGGDEQVSATVTVTTAGPHTLRFHSEDAAGNVEGTHEATFTVVGGELTFEEVAGTTRFDTAVQASKRAFPDGAPAVVLATGRNWPDALGGAALAAAYGGPVLITEPGSLPPTIAEEIARLEATKVFVLGSEKAVGRDVFEALRGVGKVSEVIRIGGASRYQTAELIAGEVVAKVGPDPGRKALVATGMNFPDALAAAPLSAAKKWPLYLCGASGLSASTRSAMATQGVQGAVVLGSERVVPAAVESGLRGTYGDGAVRRLEGDSRYGTAADIARFGVEEAGLGWDRVAIATGIDFPDALVGGVLQASRSSVVLLTPPTALAPETEAVLAAHRTEIGRLTYLGSERVVPRVVRDRVAAVLRP